MSLSLSPVRRTGILPVGAAALALLLGPPARGQSTSTTPYGSPPAQSQPAQLPEPLAPDMPRLPRGFIFFPPFPPALDAPINRSQSSTGGNVAPAPLADYVTEFFYPQLSTHLQERSLSEKQRQRLVEYRTAKLALLKELRDTLDKTAESEPPARRQALSELARRQAPKFAELEKAAEALRSDLIAPERNWSDYREWKLSDNDRRGFSPVEIAQVMRAYAYYHKGLLPQQRRMLREIVTDLALAVEETAKSKTPPPAYIYFSPAPSRITLPDDLPPEVAAKVAAYQTKKSLLKKEIYDAIYQTDGKALFLGNPLRGLANRQARPLAELDALAEEIRVGIEPVAATVQPPLRSGLPGGLSARVADLARRRNALQRDTSRRIEVIATRLRASRTPILIETRFENDGLRFVVRPTMRGGAPPRIAEEVENVRAQVTEISEDYGRQFADVMNELDTLRREAGEILGTKEQRLIDQALNQTIRADLVSQNEQAYRLYRIAVLSPGLSPDQRCLLFDAAIEELALPLPRGERQPNRRANAW